MRHAEYYNSRLPHKLGIRLWESEKHGMLVNIGCNNFHKSVLELALRKVMWPFGRGDLYIRDRGGIFGLSTRETPSPGVSATLLKMSWGLRKVRIRKIIVTTGWGINYDIVLQDLVFKKSDLRELWRELLVREREAAKLQLKADTLTANNIKEDLQKDKETIL